MRYKIKSKLIRTHKRHLWLVWVILAAIILIALGVAVAVVLLVKKTAPQTIQGVSVEPPPVATAPAPASAPAAVPVAQIPSPQNCTPYTTFDAPPQINLISQPNGLTQVIDVPLRYQIYGNTAVQIRAQVQQCAPKFNISSSEGSEFAAATDYSFSWKYNTTQDSAGNCTLSNMKVGLHINMIIPLWQPTNSATGGLAAKWQTFTNNLTAHENGHVAITQQYAAQLLRDLQAYPVSECGSISSGIQAKVNAAVTANGAANDAYDARTNHGASQGAILP